MPVLLFEEVQGSLLRPQLFEQEQQHQASHAKRDHKQDPVKPASPTPPVPVAPHLLVGPPQVTHVDTSSCSLAWDDALSRRPDDDQEHGSQEVFSYTLKHALQLQQLNVPGEDAPSASKHVRDANWRTVAEAGHAAQVHDLLPGRHYAARVVATATAVGLEGEAVSFPGVPSECRVFRTVPTPPGPPQPPALSSRARNALKLKWSPPEETGGEAIMEYVLQMQPAPVGWEQPPTDSGFYEMYRGEERSAKVVRLQPGVRYQFRLKAANKLGASPWSLCSAFSTQASVPAAPESPERVDATQDSVSLQWVAPADNGAPIGDYTLEVDDGRGGEFRVAYAGTVTAATIGQLQSGLPYRFRLRADNSEGHSSWSDVVVVTTAARPPKAPLGMSVVGVDRTSVTLAWSAPGSDGGSPILGYQVELQAKTKAAEQGLGSGWAVIYEGPSTACTFGGLQAGCTYLVRANARNAAGTGQSSMPIQVSTAADVPWQPDPPEAIAEARAFLLQWQPPGHDGGSPITEYRVQMRCATGNGEDEGANDDINPQDNLSRPVHFLDIYSGTECCVQVTDLVPGTTYVSRVAAVNKMGVGPWSTLGSATTLPSVPAPPAAPTVGTCSSNSVALSWEEPCGQGSKVVSYTVNMARIGAQPASANGSPASHSAYAAANGTMANGYHATCNGHALGSESSSMDADGDASASAGVSSDSAGLSHQLRWETVYTGPATSCEVRNLDPATTYALRVRAHNSAGGSPWGQRAVTTTAPAAPSAPTALQASATSSSELRVAWQPPLLDHGAAVASYSLEVAPAARASTKASAASTWRPVWQGPGCEAVIGELQPGRSYQLRVRAHNARGAGPWAEPVTAVTQPAPPAAPRAITFGKRSATSIKVSWSPPLDDNGAATRTYMVEAACLGPMGRQVQQGGAGAASWAAVHSGSELSASVTHLSPGTLYAFRVAAVNAAGQGAWSEEGSAATALRPPAPPVGLEAVLQEGSSAAAQLALSWVCSPMPECEQYADVVGFEVEARPAAGCAGAGSGIVSKQLGRVGSYVLGGLQPGVTYKVLLRAVGAGGAGHSAWSEAITVTLPGAPATDGSHSDASSSGAAQQDGAKSDAGMGRRRSKTLPPLPPQQQQQQERPASEVSVVRPPKRVGSGSVAPKPKGFPASKRRDKWYSHYTSAARKWLASKVGKKNMWWVVPLLWLGALIFLLLGAFLYLYFR